MSVGFLDTRGRFVAVVVLCLAEAAGEVKLICVTLELLRRYGELFNPLVFVRSVLLPY